MTLRYTSMLFGLLLATSLWAQPANDDPCDAIALPVNTSCAFTSYTNAAATASGGLMSPGCAGYAGGDVWFRFTLPNNGYHVMLEMQAGTMTDGGMAVYSGSNCGSLTLVACDDNSGGGDMPSIRVEDGCNFADAGATFWVRVWENGNDNNGTFDLCARTVSPVLPNGVVDCGGSPAAGNTCCDAILLTDLLDGYCGNTGNYTDDPSSIASFCANLDNNSWLAFIASEATAQLDITTNACQLNRGIQVGIFETSDCNNFSLVSNCWNPNAVTSGTVLATSLTPGETYYLMVDGWLGDSCEYTIDVISGVEMTSASASDHEICIGESTNLQTNVVGAGPFTYAWSPSAGLSASNIANPIATPTISTDYIVTITSPTNTSTHTVSIIVYPSVPDVPVISGETSICEGSTGIIYSATAPGATAYNWTTTGSASIVGSNTGSSVTIDWGTMSGTIQVEAINECGGSIGSQSISLTPRPNISVANPPVACAPNNSVNISSLLINNSGSGSGPVTYHASQADAEAGTPLLPSVNITNSGTYWIRMQSAADCYDVTSVDIIIENPVIAVTDPSPRCAPATIDLSTVASPEQNGFPGGMRTYYLDSLDAEIKANAMLSTTVATSGTYYVRYETSNGCYDVEPIQVTIDVGPDVPDLTEPQALCPGSSIDLDTIALPDANNAMIVIKDFYDNIGLANLGIPIFAMSSTIVNTAGSYWVRLESAAASCPEIVEIRISIATPPTAAISGGGTVCPGDSTDITFNLTGAGPFDVVLGDGTNIYAFGSISNGHIERLPVLTSPSTSFNLMAVTDQTGCTGSISGSSVVVNVRTLPTVSISGGGDLCQGDNALLTFNMTGDGPFDLVYEDSEGSIYNVSSVNNGHTESQILNTSTTFEMVSISDNLGCTNTGSGTAAFAIFPTLQVTNVLELCDASKTAYTLSFEISGGNPATYNVSGGGGTLVGNTFTSDPITANTPYSFNVSDGSACPDVSVSGLQQCLCLTNPGTMDATTLNACESGTVTASHNGDEQLEANDLLAYVIHDNNGTTLGNVFGYSNSPTFGLDVGMTAGATYYISAVAGPDDGMGSVDFGHTCFAVAQGTPVVFIEEPTVSISGDATICRGLSTDITFNISGGVPPFDVVYSDGDSDYTLDNILDGHQISVTPMWNTTYTLVQITDNTSANCLGQASGSITVNLIDELQVNNLSTACNFQKTTYTVSFDITGGDPFSYSVAMGGSMMGNVFTSDPIPANTPYSFTVSDGSSCLDLIVDGIELCPCISDPGTMDINPQEGCVGQALSAKHNGDAVLETAINDELIFILHDNPGTTLGTIYATSTAPNFGIQPGMIAGQVYYISSAVAPGDGMGNIDMSYPCFGTSAGAPIVFFDPPVATLSGDASICPGDSSDLTLNFSVGTAPFDVIISDGNQDIVLEDINNPHTIRVGPSITSTYTISSIVDNTGGDCVGTSSGSALVTVIEFPTISNVTTTCNGTNTAFQVSFEISGGNPANYSFGGDGGSYDAATQTYTSNTYINGDNYYLSVDDGGGCGIVDISGSHVCECTTQAGDMTGPMLELCADEVAIGVYDPINEVLDADDQLGFVLHDSPDATLGNILLTNTTPEFAYDPSLILGTTYYISAVVANDDGAGFPVLDASMDICHSVSIGQPVRFNALPEGSISGGITICEGATATITFNLTGQAPFDISYSDGANIFNVNDVMDGHQIEVNPTASTTYTLLAVRDQHPAGCAGLIDPANNEVTVNVLDIPEVLDLQATCNEAGTAFYLTIVFGGGQAGTYMLNGDTTATLAGDTYVSGWYISGSTYYLELTDANGCPAVVITDTEYCKCTPDIRPQIMVEQEIQCAGSNDAELEVFNINGEAPFVFTWNDGSVGAIRTDLGPGWHYVTMTDANNCETVDSVLLEEPLPILADWEVTDASCFGASDGAISLSNVSGGIGNLFYTLDVPSSFINNTFSYMSAGTYQVRITDENGCEWQESVKQIANPT
ncbi:MAG: hypothetical protein AAFP19_07255 [Bacteroidota bacterium]